MSSCGVGCELSFELLILLIVRLLLCRLIDVFVCYFLCNCRTMYDKCARNCDSSGHLNNTIVELYEQCLCALFSLQNCLVLVLICCSLSYCPFNLLFRGVLFLTCCYSAFSHTFQLVWRQESALLGVTCACMCTEMLFVILKTLIFFFLLFVYLYHIIILNEGWKMKYTSFPNMD